jgi:hypothetical protein
MDQTNTINGRTEEKEPPALDKLFEKAGDYLETRLDLVKLKTTQTTSDIVSSLISKAAVLLFIIIFLIMLNIGLAMLIGEAMGKTYYGFFVVGLFYALVGLMVHVFRRQWIKHPVSDKIIKKMTRL